METIKKAFKSRGNITLIALFMVNTIPQVMDLLPPKAKVYANVVLSVATLYFKLFPSQEYGISTAPTDLSNQADTTNSMSE